MNETLGFSDESFDLMHEALGFFAHKTKKFIEYLKNGAPGSSLHDFFVSMQKHPSWKEFQEDEFERLKNKLDHVAVVRGILTDAKRSQKWHLRFNDFELLEESFTAYQEHLKNSSTTEVIVEDISGKENRISTVIKEAIKKAAEDAFSSKSRKADDLTILWGKLVELKKWLRQQPVQSETTQA